MIRITAALLLAASMAFAGHASPYALRATTLLPAMPEGDFDQLAADVAHSRLYVSAEDGGTMYVFDLRTGALIRSGGAVKSPHKVVFDSRHDRLFVADGDDGAVEILDPNLKLVARIPVGPKADTGLIDAGRRIFYVGSRDPQAPDSRSIVSAISTDSLAVIKTWPIAATTLKGMILDPQARRLLVSLRDRNAIGVIHLDTGSIESWNPPGLHKSVPLAFDAANHAIYAGSRGPGALDVLDATDGHLRATLPSTETSDSISFDRTHHRLYLSGDSGMSRYDIGRDGTVRLLETSPELIGKTSLYVPQLRRLYVMRPRKGATAAALTMFDVTE